MSTKFLGLGVSKFRGKNRSAHINEHMNTDQKKGKHPSSADYRDFSSRRMGDSNTLLPTRIRPHSTTNKANYVLSSSSRVGFKSSKSFLMH